MLRAEFTVFPFREGEALPAHVQAAVDAVRRADVDVEVGPLGTTVTGEASAVLSALHAAARAAVAAGATRVAISVEVIR